MTETQPEKRLIGYARVSTYGQTLDAQLDQIRAAGCTSRNIYCEKVAGAHGRRWCRCRPTVPPATGIAPWRLMLAVLGGLADVERDLIRTRTAEARNCAKAQGQQMGRPPVRGTRPQLQCRHIHNSPRHACRMTNTRPATAALAALSIMPVCDKSACRCPIKMSPLCHLQMTLPGGFPGGVGGDGSADERWGA